jgi:ADP-ribosylglycohydrolase
MVKDIEIIKKQECYLGCLTGLAVGDSMGTTLEFESPGEGRVRQVIYTVKCSLTNDNFRGTLKL